MCPRNAPQPAIVLSDPPQDRCQTLVRQDFESAVGGHFVTFCRRSPVCPRAERRRSQLDAGQVTHRDESPARPLPGPDRSTPRGVVHAAGYKDNRRT